MDPIVVFNDQLRRLSTAGLPLDLGLSDSAKITDHQSLPQWINQAENALRIRLELGQPRWAAIDQATELTPRYRTALKTWLETNDVIAFESFVQPAQYQIRRRHQVGIALLPPLLVAVVAFAAFVILCSITVPKWEAVYVQLWKQPTGMLVFLQQARTTMPIWSVAIPIGILISCFVWYRYSTTRNWGWLPGGAHYYAAQRHAGIADRLASLLERNVPLATALQIADPDFAADFKSNPSGVPPLIRWALTGDLGNEPMPKVLRFVASSYRDIAGQFAGGLRIAVPTGLVVIASGLLVFLFGLCLFMPITEILKTIASSSRG